MPEPSSAEWIPLARAIMLLGPVLLAMVLAVVSRLTPRQATAAMVGGLWQLPALLLFNVVAQKLGWWRFQHDAASVLGLPVDLWIGWAFLWGPAAVLLSARLPGVAVVAGMVLADALFMPRLAPLIVLGKTWWIGEVVGVASILLPALVLARATEADTRPVLRTCFHGLGWGGYMLLVLPACALAWEDRDYLAVLQSAGPARWAVALALGLPCLLIGWAAAHEFALVGRGTPIPYDPPKRVVTSGPYASIANPMQVTSTIVMIAMAILVNSAAAWTIPLAFLIFEGIFATWYNRAHIALAMPEDWDTYSAAVCSWVPRGRPYIARRATLRFPDSGRDARLIAWLMRRVEKGLTIELEPTPPSVARQRLVYTSSDPALDATGIAALGRAMEHLGGFSAIIGWSLRLPGVHHLTELASFTIPVRRAVTRIKLGLQSSR